MWKGESYDARIAALCAQRIERYWAERGSRCVVSVEAQPSARYDLHPLYVIQSNLNGRGFPPPVGDVA